MSNIKPYQEAYPMAQAPGAQTLQQVFEQWQAHGLTPVECTTEELRQTITIEHDALKRDLKWSTRKMDGVQALGIMATAMVDMWRYFIKAEGRPELSSGLASVAVRLEGNRLTVGLNPVDDPTVVKGALIAALFEVIDRDRGDIEEGLLEFFTIEG